jgi:hypothetical protein
LEPQQGTLLLRNCVYHYIILAPSWDIIYYQVLT